MSETVLTAVITGGLSLVGVVLSNLFTFHQTGAKLERNQAVTETRLEALTQEVRRHNNFAVRMPVVEEQIKVINHRISDLERTQEK